MAEEISKERPEDIVNPSDKYLEVMGELYGDFYKFRNYRLGNIRQLQYHSFEDFLKKSRELFWNSTLTQSQDLEELGLEFSFPFIRKEVIDFVGRLVALNVNPHLSGDELNQYSVKVLHAMYKKWRMKSKDKVEKFWQVLYGIVNGTVCSYIGWDGSKSTRRYITSFDPETGDYNIDEKEVKMWNDVFSEIVPIEEIYLEKIWERNIQKQNKTIRKQEMTLPDFKKEFGMYKNSEYVTSGNRIAEDSLFFELLGGTGITTTDKIQVFTKYDIKNDKKIIGANGIWLNPMKGDTEAPNPFDHKMQPYTWTQMYQPIDEKFAYGLSLPFMAKDQHKLLNTSYCVTPDTNILTKDLKWVTAESLKAGDKLVGFDEFGRKNKNKKTGRGSVQERRLQEASVTKTGRMIAPVYKVTLEDGTELKCTGNHRWLVWTHDGGSIKWKRTDEIKKELEDKTWRGVGHKIFMPKPFDVVEPDLSSDEKLNNSTLRSDTRVKIESVAYIGEQEIITLESSTKTYIAEGFCAHNTMLMESELRAIDPPYLSADIESPNIIFGDKKVIPVTDVNAYKQIEVKEPSNQFFTMMNSLSETMSAHAQGGAAQIIPSRQPKSAREIIAMDSMKQQTMSASLLMYYDLVYQEIMLVLKTALQFYASGKYDGKEIMRTITIPEFPLTGGGVGQMEVRIRKEPSSALNLYFESVNKSIANGKATEIIEMSPEIMNNLDWFIDKITLEPEKTPEMERAQFFEQVMQPMMNVFMPMGLADPSKVFMRYLEKFGEHPADYANSQVLPQMMGQRGRAKYNIPAQGMPGTGRSGMGAMTGNINQSLTGTQFGSQSNGGIPGEEYLSQ